MDELTKTQTGAMRRRLLFAEELMKKHRHTKTEKKAFRLRGGFRERDRPTLKSDTRTDDEEVEESLMKSLRRAERNGENMTHN